MRRVYGMLNEQNKVAQHKQNNNNNTKQYTF
jgi:hypothetical protein